MSKPDKHDIYNQTSGDMTLSEINWILDSYWFWLHNTAATK